MNENKVASPFETPQIPMMWELVIEPTVNGLLLPKYASEGDSGMDVCSQENYVLAPGETHLFKLGFKMQIPKHPLFEWGYRWEAQARPRSGLSKNTMLRVSNSPGTIDNLYIAEVGILLTNTAPLLRDLTTSSMNALTKVDGDYESFIREAELTTNLTQSVPTLEGLEISRLQLAARGVTSPEVSGWFPDNSIFIGKGDRIAQLVFNEVIRPAKIRYGTVDPNHDRDGGFGSSGVNG